MPWDLIFYGSMGVIFIGLMISSSRARRGRKAGAPGGAATAVPAPDAAETGSSDGGGGSD